MIFMKNNIKKEMNTIYIPEELSERSKRGVLQAKREMFVHKKRRNVKGILVMVAVAAVVASLFVLFNEGSLKGMMNNPNEIVVHDDGSIEIPAIQLPKDTSSADMIGLIVYNGKFFTQTGTDILPEDAKDLVGQKLGRTKGNIDEWSKQDAYSEEFASSIGPAEVYAVKGYDTDFRIMTYEEQEGVEYAMFFEHLNGITIKSGEDVFGKLNLAGNVSSVYYRTVDDWNYDIENYVPIIDMYLLNDFVTELNQAVPFPRTEQSDPIIDSRSSDNFRELALHLKDGSIVKLILLKDGYIYYGGMAVYFEMDEQVFSKMWQQMK